MYNADELLKELIDRFDLLSSPLSSGERIQVTHPEQVIVTDTDDLVGIGPGPKEGRKAYRLIGLDHLRAVEIGQPT